MGRLQVKKIVVSCFLEAAKLATEQCSTFRNQLAERGHSAAPELPRVYGDLRQLRDYLQRCSSSYQETLELDMSSAGIALLVAVCRRFVDAIDLQLQGVIPDQRDRQFLVKKRQLVSDWAVELAQKPLYELPLPRLVQTLGDGGRALQMRMQEKLFAVREQRMIRDGNSTVIGASLSEPNQVLSGQTVGAPLGFDFGPMKPEAPPTPASPAPAASPPPTPSLYDSSLLRDPRLRAMAGIDLRSLRHADEARDHRIAALMLGSSLEIAMLDYALTRRADLGLAGNVETWDPQELALKVLGESAHPSDQAQAYNLFCMRAQLSPARQLATPVVVTEASLDRMREFAERVLQAMGMMLPGGAGFMPAEL
ncbi:MAG: hypothetical protein U1E73_03155 [Planctomycetota bacterium]